MEDFGHGAAHADLIAVPAFAEDVVEVEDVSELDSQALADLAVVVPQAEADFEDAVGLDETGDDRQAIGAMQLKDEGAVGECKLNDMRPAAFFASLEGGAGLGVESGDPRGQDLLGGGFALGFGVGHVDAVGRETGEGGQEGGFGFGQYGRTGLGSDLFRGGPAFRRFAEESGDTVEPGRSGRALRLFGWWQGMGNCSRYFGENRGDKQRLSVCG